MLHVVLRVYQQGMQFVELLSCSRWKPWWSPESTCYCCVQDGSDGLQASRCLCTATQPCMCAVGLLCCLPPGSARGACVSDLFDLSSGTSTRLNLHLWLGC